MSTTKEQQDTNKRHEYAVRNKVERLRREIFQQKDLSASHALMDELVEAEQELEEIGSQSVVDEKESLRGVIINTEHKATRRGLGTTGLEAKVFLKMEHVPTSMYHLLDPDDHPLIVCEVKAAQRGTVGGAGDKRRVRVTSFIEKYSAKAVNTFEIPEGEEPFSFKQLPTLFINEIRNLTELTRGTLNILVEDLDGRVEIHETKPIWMLANTSAPLAIKDPSSGTWLDMTRYLGAFVTPNAPSLMKFLRTAANYHPAKRLVGYQGSEAEVTQQVKALFDALKSDAHIVYVNSVIDFNPDKGAATQRVRLPRESLSDGQANCIDGTVLFASLLEAASLNPAIVLIPGHAFLAWETWENSNKWRFLETTMIGTSTFEEACRSAENTAKIYSKSQQLKQYPLSKLRTQHGVMPME